MAKHTYIKLKTVDQRLLIVQQPLIASGDVGTVYVEYALDSYWDGYTVYGTFYTGRFPTVIFEVKLENNACVIPWEVLQANGVLYIGLRGVDEAGLVKTAAPVKYRVAKGSYGGTCIPQDKPSQSGSIFDERIQAAVDAYMDKVGVTGSGIGEDAKNLLIKILRGATYTTNMSDDITKLTEALNNESDGTEDDTGSDSGGSVGGDNGGNTGSEDDTNVDVGDDYEKVVVNASISAVSNTQGVELGNYNNGQRATLLASGGIVNIPITGDGGLTTYSLIRIPRGTSKVTINGSAEFTFGVFIFELLDSTTFSKRVDSGWIDMTGSYYVYDLSTDYADGNHYIAVNFRQDNTNTFDVESYKNVLSLNFGDVINNNTGSGDDMSDNNTIDVSAILVSASVTGSSTTGAELGNYENNQRATLLTTDGDIKLTVPATGETTNYSLIPIPANATALLLTGSADFHYGVSIFSVSNGTKYTQQLDSGWIDMTSNEAEYTIASEYADGNQYIAVNFRLDTYGTFSIDDYAKAIGIRFIFD